MNKMEQLKDKLYEIAKTEMPSAIEEMNEIFAREIEIPVSGEYNIDQDPEWFDINDFVEK